MFGGAPSYAVEQPQNIFETVRSWQCTSTPMTASYPGEAVAGGGAVVGCVTGRVSGRKPLLDPDRSVSPTELSRSLNGAVATRD